MIRKGLLALLIFLCSISAYSQQMPLYSQYMLNGFVYNPAMAGHDGLTVFNLTSRQQWLGMENAPRSFSLSAQTRLLMRNYMIKRNIIKGNKIIKARKGRVGLGINIYNDRNGYFNQSGTNFSYAYHVSFYQSQLSFGVSASLTQFKINTSGISFRDQDVKFLQLGKPIYVPDANAGIFYERTNLYMGVSVANLLQSQIKYGNPYLESYQLKRHYYGIIGYKFDDGKSFIYEPAILLKTTEAIVPQVDLSFKVAYNEGYWLGASYRSLRSFIFFVGIKRYNFSAGYAFDYDFNSLQKFTYGSHELNLALHFGDSARRYKWIKRF